MEVVYCLTRSYDTSAGGDDHEVMSIHRTQAGAQDALDDYEQEHGKWAALRVSIEEWKLEP